SNTHTLSLHDALPISRTWVEHAINGGMREKLPRFFGALLDGEFVSRDDGPQLHECTYRRIHRHEIRVDHRNRRVANPTLCAPTRSEERRVGKGGRARV